MKEVLTLARHTTPDLTMNVYARTKNERLAALVEKVGENVLPESARALCVHSGGGGGYNDIPMPIIGRDLDVFKGWPLLLWIV